MKRRKNRQIVLSTDEKSSAWNRSKQTHTHARSSMWWKAIQTVRIESGMGENKQSSVNWTSTTSAWGTFMRTISVASIAIMALSCHAAKQKILSRSHTHTHIHEYIVLCVKVNHLFSLGGLSIMSFELRRIPFILVFYVIDSYTASTSIWQIDSVWFFLLLFFRSFCIQSIHIASSKFAQSFLGLWLFPFTIAFTIKFQHSQCVIAFNFPFSASRHSRILCKHP